MTLSVYPGAIYHRIWERGGMFLWEAGSGWFHLYPLGGGNRWKWVSILQHPHCVVSHRDAVWGVHEFPGGVYYGVCWLWKYLLGSRLELPAWMSRSIPCFLVGRAGCCSRTTHWGSAGIYLKLARNGAWICHDGTIMWISEDELLIFFVYCPGPGLIPLVESSVLKIRQWVKGALWVLFLWYSQSCSTALPSVFISVFLM